MPFSRYPTQSPPKSLHSQTNHMAISYETHSRVCRALVLAILVQVQQVLTINRPSFAHTPKQRLEKTPEISEPVGGFPHHGNIATQISNDGQTSLVESAPSLVNKHASHRQSLRQELKLMRHSPKATAVMDSSGAWGEIETQPESTHSETVAATIIDASGTTSDVMPNMYSEQLPPNSLDRYRHQVTAQSLTESRLGKRF